MMTAAISNTSLSSASLHTFGKELKCPVCLSLLRRPTTRLSCSHYFCKSCVDTSLGTKSTCPLCNAPASRRAVFRDPKIDVIVGLYALLEAKTGQQYLCTQLPSSPGYGGCFEAGNGDPGAGASLDASMLDTSPDCHHATSQQQVVAPLCTAHEQTTGDSKGRGASQISWDAGVVVPVTIEGASQGATPVEPEAADQAPRAPLDGARRIPSRLQPWACQACTFTNLGSCARCDMCGTVRGAVLPADPPTNAPAGAQVSLTVAKPSCEDLGCAQEAAVDTRTHISHVFQKEGHTGIHPHDAPGAVAKTRPRGHVLVPRPRHSLGPAHPAVSQHAQAPAAQLPATGQPKPRLPLGGRRAIAPHLGCKQPSANKSAVLHEGLPPTAAKEAPPAACPLPALKAGPNPETGDGAHGRKGSRKRGRQTSTSPIHGGNRTASADRSRCRRGASAGLMDGVLPPLRSWPPGRGAYVLLGSGLDKSQQSRLKDLQMTSGAQLVAKWDPHVTHVVCGLDDKGATKRTLKYLQGIVTGRWVVSMDWVEACLTARGPQPEAAFEVKEDSAGFHGGPILGRLRVAEGFQLLRGYEVYLAGRLAEEKQVVTLVKSTGARLLTRAPAPNPLIVQQRLNPAAGGAKPCAVMLHEVEGPLPSEEVKAGVLQLSSKWLMDSSSCFEVQDMAKYILT